MKVSKLKEMLSKFPDDMEVCVPTEEGNIDIFFLEPKPGYWDGPYQVLERDWACKYYNVIGARYTDKDEKLCINTLSIKEALLDDPDMPVKVEDHSIDKRMQKEVDRWRDEMKKINDEVK